MYLDALFPGVNLDEVRADIPWELKVADPLGSFPVPKDEEIVFLRQLSPISPFKNATARKLAMEHIKRQMEEKAAAR